MNRFEVQSTGEQNHDIQLLKFRKLSTILDLGEFDPDTPLQLYGGVEALVSGFPRLRQLLTKVPRPTIVYGGPQPERCSFRQILTILEQLDHLQALTLTAEEPTNFSEDYFSAKSKHITDQIIAKIANIKKLELHWGTTPCINSIKFVMQYMKNLKVLNICSLDLKDITTEQAAFLFNHFIHFTLSIPSFQIDLYDMAPTLFHPYFLSIVKERMPSGGELRVDFLCGPSEEYTVSLHLEPKKVRITLED